MKLLYWFAIGASIIGLASGASALEATADAQPPFQWPDIPLVFLASAFCVVFVVGIQLFRREPKHAKYGFLFLVPGALFFTASGMSALTLSVFSRSVTPNAVAFLAVGLGLMVGLAASWAVFRRRYRNAL